jgi:Gluconate 2-dehydrogenase subunit 3
MEDLAKTDDLSAKRRGISRRKMVQTLLSGASTGIIASSIPAPAAAEVRPPAPGAVAEQTAQPAEWNPLFLDSHQADTLNVLAEIIIPGSTKAEVTQFIDLLLSEDTVENRAQFVAAISAMDGEAMQQEGRPFKELAPARQIEILTLASKIAASVPAGNGGGSAKPSGAAPPPNLRDHFENLKEWVRKTYYSSEVGLRELGWSDNYFYDSLPPCNGTTS